MSLGWKRPETEGVVFTSTAVCLLYFCRRAYRRLRSVRRYRRASSNFFQLCWRRISSLSTTKGRLQAFDKARGGKGGKLEFVNGGLLVMALGELG